jgi:hypothetical protein
MLEDVADPVRYSRRAHTRLHLLAMANGWRLFSIPAGIELTIKKGETVKVNKSTPQRMIGDTSTIAASS